MSCNCKNKETCGCVYSTLSFVYQGEELSCIDIPTGMSLEAILTQINNKFCELVTAVTNVNTSSYTLDLNINDLILRNDGNAVSTVDISKFLDNLNLSRIVSNTVDAGAKRINLIRDDNTSISIDISSMFTVQPNTTNSSLNVTGNETKTITLNDSANNSIQGTFTDNDTKPNSVTVTGGDTKTITIGLSDNTEVSGTFTDNNGGDITNSSVTLTPLMEDPQGDIVYNYATNSGKLIRYGNICSFNIDFTGVNSLGSSAGNNTPGRFTITGLPYTAANKISINIDQLRGMSFEDGAGNQTLIDATQVTCMIDENSSDIIFTLGLNSSLAALTRIRFDNSSPFADMFISGTFITNDPV